MTDKITVICECCAKEIQENKANSFYKNNNYLIVCDECYEKLLQAQVMADKYEKLNKWLPIVTRLEQKFGSYEKAKGIDYQTYTRQVFAELDQLKEELQDKEQEYEALHGYISRLEEELEIEEAEALRAEVIMIEKTKEADKYKQALTEIKQLLEDALEYFHDSDTGSTYDKIELILQKCEVLDEN